jgi:hypothetical protein
MTLGEKIQQLRNLVSEEYFNNLSQLISALTLEGLFVPKVEVDPKLPEYWQDFITKVNLLFASNVEMRNRFRRLVVPRKLIQLSDMVLALARIFPINWEP